MSSRSKKQHHESTTDSNDDYVKMKKTVENNENEISNNEKTPTKPPTRRLRRTRTPSLKALQNHCISESPETPPKRRSTRKITPNKKYDDKFIKEQPSKQIKTLNISINTLVSSNETSDGSEILQPSNLFEEDLDIEGKRIFTFQTPKKRDGMSTIVSTTPKTITPKTDTRKRFEQMNLQTPEKGRDTKFCPPKTPRHVRKKLKHEISKILLDSSNSDFSPDDSEFEPNSASSSSLSSSVSEDEVETKENDDEETISTRKSRRIIKIPTLSRTTTSSLSKRRIGKTEEYVPQSDEYFNSHSSNKIITSDHTLDRLKNPRLPHEHLFNLLTSMKLSTIHEKSISTLLDEYKTYFPKWLYILNEGYSILLYGLGSKRNLLQKFHQEMLEKQPVIIVNGFFPSLTIKDILDSITNEILDLQLTNSNLHEIVNRIEDEFNLLNDKHLFLIIHNIDGTMLRNSKAQDILSRLSKINNIHLLASIDHINTPLLWDHSKLSNYNFSWWDITTMLPYTDETAFENSLLVQNSGELALSSMRNVVQSLTTNAKGIYMIIVKNQLKCKGNPNYQGMAFKDLYWSCREAFLVSSDLALRAQLTEFLDHKLVKTKRTIDGTEHLIIPIESGLLQQFIEQQQE